MRIARFVVDSRPTWGFVEGEDVLEASGPWEDVLTAELESLARLRQAAVRSYRLDAVRLLPAVGRPSKIIGLARNYRTHGPRDGEVTTPTLFGMVPSAIIGPGDSIRLPRESSMVDWEAELAVVIGSRAKSVAAADALDHIAGYTVLNDVSARDPQIVAGQLFRAKAFDTFKPIGPWLTTTDDLGDAGNLAIRLWVNGDLKQDARTSDLIAGVRDLVEFCSSTFTLEPGDVIATGTPGGVGASRTPPEFLSSGDVVTVEIEGIGRLENDVRNTDEGMESDGGEGFATTVASGQRRV